MLADFKAYFFVSQVRLGTKSILIEDFLNFEGKISLFISDIQNHRLGRRQPSRECTFVMLDQHADETLEGTQDRAMQHDRSLPTIVLGNIGGIQALRHIGIVLQRTALPSTPQ